MPNLILSQSVRLQRGSTPAAHLLSQTRCWGTGFEIQTAHNLFIFFFIRDLWSAFDLNLCCSFLCFSQIRSHLHLQTSCPSEYSPALTDVRFDHQLSQNSKSYKANLSSLESASISFHPLSHKILHLTPRNVRERGKGYGRESSSFCHQATPGAY